MMHRFFLTFFIILIATTTAFSQKLTISCHEKLWATNHIFIANKAKKISKEAYNVTQEVKREGVLGTDGNGGLLDAFRHTYWMARLAQEIKPKKAIKLGKAHERKNYKEFLRDISSMQDSVSIQMDLLNNEIGVEIGEKHKEYDKEQLKNIIINNIKNGNLFIIKKDTKGRYLDADNNIINNAEWQGIYVNKRCLVKSNY